MFKYYLFKIVRAVFPTKQNDKKTIIIKSVSLVAIIGIIICSIWLGSIEIEHAVLKHENKEIQNVMQNILENRDPESDLYDFELLHEQNPDIRAWIVIPGTDINYPICQTKDNDYYLKHNFNKKFSPFGTLFFDCQNDVATSQNLTVYGHSLKNSQMFTNIRKYAKLDYYKEHPIIQLITPEGMVEYKVFAAMVMNAVPEDDNGYLYPFMQTDFTRQRDFINWIEEAYQRSIIQTPVDILPDDRILTLSTCGYEFENQRFVVMARQVRTLDGESRDVAVNDARRNPNPRYPKKWYDTKKMKYPWATES